MTEENTQLIAKTKRLLIPQKVKDNKEAIINQVYTLDEWKDLEKNILPEKNKVLDAIRTIYEVNESDIFKEIIKKAYLDEAIRYLFTEKKDVLDNIVDTLPEKPARCKQCGADAITDMVGETTMVSCPTETCLIHEYVKGLSLEEWNKYMESK